MNKKDFSKEVAEFKSNIHFFLSEKLNVEGKIVTVVCYVDKITHSPFEPDYVIVDKKTEFNFSLDLLLNKTSKNLQQNNYYVSSRGTINSGGLSTFGETNGSVWVTGATSGSISNYPLNVSVTNNLGGLDNYPSIVKKELEKRGIMNYSLNFGYSICLPEDDYNTDLGLWIAIGRAVSGKRSNKIGVIWNTFLTSWGNDINKVLVYGIFEKACSDIMLKPNKYFVER